MTELSSPLWDPDGRGYCWAPWLEVFLLDPSSGEVTQEEGQIALVDFVNWGSVMAIETRDRGRMVEGRLQLLGRLEGADARGCSLAMEELLP